MDWVLAVVVDPGDGGVFIQEKGGMVACRAPYTERWMWSTAPWMPSSSAILAWILRAASQHLIKRMCVKQSCMFCFWHVQPSVIKTLVHTILTPG